MTDQDHAKIVREKQVTQADREAAADLMIALFKDAEGLEGDLGWAEVVRSGDDDDYPTVQALARHRLAAEAAAFEKAAAYIEGKGGVIPGSTVFIPLITGSNQPCMSGDGRDHLHPHKRRQFDDAVGALAAAIRNLAGEKHD